MHRIQTVRASKRGSREALGVETNNELRSVFILCVQNLSVDGVYGDLCVIISGCPVGLVDDRDQNKSRALIISYMIFYSTL